MNSSEPRRGLGLVLTGFGAFAVVGCVAISMFFLTRDNSDREALEEGMKITLEAIAQAQTTEANLIEMVKSDPTVTPVVEDTAEAKPRRESTPTPTPTQEPTATVEVTSTPTDLPVDEYVMVTDDYQSIQVSVPVEWDAVYGEPWVADDGDVWGAQIVAANDLEAYASTYAEPGVSYRVSDYVADLVGYIQLLDIRRSGLEEYCDYEGREDYDDGVFRGKLDVFFNCDGEEVMYIVVSAVSKENQSDYLVLLELQVPVVGDNLPGYVEEIFNTFDVIGELPNDETVLQETGF